MNLSNNIELINQVDELMTPKEILERTSFPDPEVITPGKFDTFEKLLQRRTSIRDLELLPVKSDELRAHYRMLDKVNLAWDVVYKFEGRNLRLAANEYPYVLPENVIQLILWIKKHDTHRSIVAEYLASQIEEYKFDPDRIILFERPLGITTKMVRGTFPQVRHLHVWVSI